MEAKRRAEERTRKRDAQVQETYAAAAKIQAGARGRLARRAAQDRMKKIELSKDEKVAKMVENVFRTIRQHLKSDRKLYGKKLADAAEAFRAMDKDDSGALSEVEFGRALHRMGLGLTQEQVEAVVQFVDVSGDGELDYNEYISLLAKDDPDLANTEEAHILETRRRDARERRKAKRKAAAKKSARMRKESALSQSLMTADERVAYLDAKASRQKASSAVEEENTDPLVSPLELSDQPVQFGENNWVPHQHSFDEDTSGFGFDSEPPKEPPLPSRSSTGHRSWRDWCRANEGQVSQMLTPSKTQTSTDTAEIKLLKDKFKALVYGRNKDPATLLFKKFVPHGECELDLPEFTEAIRRHWKRKGAPLTRKQILHIFKACDADSSGQIDMLELAEFVWGKESPEAARAKVLMESGSWKSPRADTRSPLDTPRGGIEYMQIAAVDPGADGPAPTLQETMELRSKLKQASYAQGGQNPAVCL